MSLPTRLPFTATRWQISTYLLGVALFSISFLVFLNSSISFVITDLIGLKSKVGNAVGTLGFADELLALFACPAWGLLSDRIGVRAVCVAGYTIVGLSLMVLVQSQNVYPQLLLARLLFSIGGAATSTMVTAILPAMTSEDSAHSWEVDGSNDDARPLQVPENAPDDTSAAAPTTPEDSGSSGGSQDRKQGTRRSGNSQIAGLVGMFTGIGALLALGLFLPLPARLRKVAGSPREAVVLSFYVVAAIAFLVALACSFGLRGLAGEQHKSLRSLLGKDRVSSSAPRGKTAATRAFFRLGCDALRLGFMDTSIGLGYLGGFVARASSVAISLFIPLFVNAYFISAGLCKEDPHTSPTDIKNECERAYKLAAALTGVSQVSALVFAPIFGYADGRFSRLNVSLLTAALAGVCGYTFLARTTSPDPKEKSGNSGIFIVMILLGFSQIGAIVCSLSVLARGIQGHAPTALQPKSSRRDGQLPESPEFGGNNQVESDPLLPKEPAWTKTDRAHLQGSIAGVYSFVGGAGILLLTKLGGSLFDTLSHGAPFYMLAIFNGLLFLVGLTCGIRDDIYRRQARPLM